MSWFKKTAKIESKLSAAAPAAQVGQPNMDQMVAMLASAPEEKRTEMLGDRLAVFASQAMRGRTMKDMLVAALKLPEAEYQKVAASRFKALQSLPSDTQMMLMKSHAATVKSLPPEQQGKEMKGDETDRLGSSRGQARPGYGDDAEPRPHGWSWMSTPVRFVLAYVAVLSVMLAWWLGMKQAATVGPVLLLVVAYTVLAVVWWAVVAQTRSGQRVQHER